MRTELRLLAGKTPEDMEAVRHIANNLREWDRKEIFACFWEDDPEELVRRTFFCPEAAWVAYHDGVPAAVIGTLPILPSVWSSFAFGTDDFRNVGLLLTRHTHKFIIPMLKRVAVRVECLSIEGHHEAHRWLESFGMVREATHPAKGRSGETFHTYAWRA